MEHVQLNPTIYRKESKGPQTEVNFVIGNGGIGDYICYLSALEWIAKNHPQVLGRIYCGGFFMPIPENVFKKYPKWRVIERGKLTEELIKSRPTFAPHQEYPDRLGMHSVDLGFVYYADMNPPPADGNFYPKLDFTEMDLGAPSSPYAVMTPYSTGATRTMDPQAFNGIKDFLIRKGITPLFIGKKDVTDKRSVDLHPDYDFSGGIDMRNQTTLLSAAGLMSRAKVVVGLDNGLLHLAAMTEVPIVFGFTVSSPEHAKPRRKSGKVFSIYPNPEDLTCMFCQSRMRFVYNQDFRECPYQDLACIKVLADPEPWCEQIEQALA